MSDEYLGEWGIITPTPEPRKKDMPIVDPFRTGAWGDPLKARPVIDKNPLENVDLPGRSARLWARTPEGRAAIAEEMEPPAPRIFQRPDKTWGLRKMVQFGGDDTPDDWRLYSGPSKMSVILDCLFDDGKSEKAHARIAKEFMEATPDYIATEDVYCRLAEWLVMNNAPFNVNNLSLAWEQIKPNVSSRAQQIAAREIALEQSQIAERAALEELSDNEISETLSTIRRARANYEI